MGRGTRVAGALLAVLLLLAVPATAIAIDEGAQVPPIGTVVLVFGVSDGVTVLPVGTAMLPAGSLCGPGETGG